MPRAIEGLLLLAAVALPAAAHVDRVVVLKIDGLPPRLLEQTSLPWIEHIFRRNGASVDHFYVRGLSLSAPSWSLLDTGRPQEIRGNVEYDRYTLRAYDYLNFFPFYVGAATSGRVDMRGVELLDELGVPLLLDRFPVDQRQQSFQLLQRGVRWETLKSTLKRLVAKSPSELLDEWIVGLSPGNSLNRQFEHELIQALQNPKLRYLDLFSGDFDHAAHLTNDPVSLRHKLQELDALVGRVWTAIQNSPLAQTTVLVLVSDHGINTEPGVFSQGYSLVEWFAKRAGGAHHVLTNRHPLQEFKLKGLDPFVSAVITPSPESLYPNPRASEYPTAVLDLDGNERASIGLRNNTLNILHVLLSQLSRKGLDGAQRAAALDAFFKTLERVREPWTRDVETLQQQLGVLDGRIADLRKTVLAHPKKWTPQQRAQQLHLAATRQARALAILEEDRRDYAAYAAVISRLLRLTPADFDPLRVKIPELIPPRSLGPANTVWDLQNYIAGLGPEGLVLDAQGALDWERSFTRVNYFEALQQIRVRNNVQAAVDPRVVDFIAVETPAGIWLYRDASRQLLITREADRLCLRPVAGLTGQPSGAVAFTPASWRPGLPLAYFEDPELAFPPALLADCHTERQWLEATHRTRYSNAIVSLAAHFAEPPPLDPYQDRKRRLRRTDLLVVANDHWNFNARGFNPGGNHGSFLRVSTHSVLMFAGGARTGVPAGVSIATPYDSLSFVPTILALMGRDEPDLPGPVIRELLPPR
jgi:hypothetical protein